MKQRIWSNPPRYKGPRRLRNRRVINAFKTMASGLAAIAPDACSAERLSNVRLVLDYLVTDDGKAEIRYSINPVFDDFVAVRDAMNDGDREEIAESLDLLESDVKKLSNLIRERVAETPWSYEIDGHILKYMQKVSVVRELYKRSEDDRRRKHKQKAKAESDLVVAKTASERERLERKIRKFTTYCIAKDRATSTFEDILDELDELTEFAKCSPALAKRINSVVNLKAVADFYAHPQKAQREREKIKNELYYIIKSLEKQDVVTETWSAVLYGTEKTNVSEDPVFEEIALKKHSDQPGTDANPETAAINGQNKNTYKGEQRS